MSRIGAIQPPALATSGIMPVSAKNRSAQAVSTSPPGPAVSGRYPAVAGSQSAKPRNTLTTKGRFVDIIV